MSVPQAMQDQWPGVVFNDSPRLADGSRAMFVRILAKQGVKELIDMLQELNPQAPGIVDEETKMTRIYAPDGDLVLGITPCDDRMKHFICRCHREVFAQ